jgi:hypothetical protein
MLRLMSSASSRLTAGKAAALLLMRSGELERALQIVIECCSVCADELKDYSRVVETVQESREVFGPIESGSVLLAVLNALSRTDLFFSAPTPIEGKQVDGAREVWSPVTRIVSDIDILATASIGHQTVAATAKVWGHHNNAIALLRR